MPKNDKEIQQQIQVLATNLEILNQRLHQDPDAIISPGEKAIKDSIGDIQERLQFMQDLLKSTQTQSNLYEEKEAIQKEVNDLNRAVVNLKKFDKEWIDNLLNQMAQFNTNTIHLNENTQHLASNIYRVLDTQRATITKNIYHKLFRALKKDNLVMMGFTTLLSSTVALVVLLSLLFFVK